MCVVLALCHHTVVAGRAVAAHLGVVKVEPPGSRRWVYGNWRTGRSTGCGWRALAVARTVVPMRDRRRKSSGALEHGVGVTGTRRAGPGADR